MIDHLWNLLLLDYPVTWLIFTGLIIIGLSQINFVRGNIDYYFHKMIGYGSCMNCGKKRETMWLLVCNKCYKKKENKNE